MTADELRLENPLAEWERQKRRSLDGEVITTADVVDPPPITLGVFLRSGTRRYVDSDLGVGLGGMVYDGAADTGWRVVEVKANPQGGTRIEWHLIVADEIDWLEFTGVIPKKVLRDLRGALIRHMRDRADDRRYLTALNVVAWALS